MTQQVLDFWFGLDPTQWWKADPALDAQISERFLALWKEMRDSVPAAFLRSADEALAGVILFDQFPRDMFRSEADQFSTRQQRREPPPPHPRVARRMAFNDKRSGLHTMKSSEGSFHPAAF